LPRAPCCTGSARRSASSWLRRRHSRPNGRSRSRGSRPCRCSLYLGTSYSGSGLTRPRRFSPS
jgi:hypothetical protein